METFLLFSIAGATLLATIGAIKVGDIFWSIFGLLEIVFCLSLIFDSQIENFIKEIRAILDTKRQERLDQKNHVRYSTMTHSDFVQWLTNTCANTPNHISKYIGCEVDCAGDFFYKIITKVQTKQGT